MTAQRDNGEGEGRDWSPTRRGVLAAGLGLIATACGSAVHRVGASHATLLRDALPAKGTVPTPPPPPAQAPAGPGSTLTRVPVTAVPARTKPAYYVHDVLPTAPANAVALTIDDGPHPVYTPEVLAVLAQYQVQATFSVIGRQAVQYPQLIKSVLAAGHGLANHSFSHPQPFATLDQARMTEEIVRGLEAVYDATGKTTLSFRSPGGDWSPPMYQLIAELGMTPIDWDVDPRDWSTPGTAFITSRLLAAKAGDILLCHDGGGNRSETVAALKTVLPVLKQRGLQFVTL